MTHMGQTLQTKRFNTLLFLFLKYDDVPQGSFTIYQVNKHDPRKKNIYGGVGILTIFKIFGHFLFEGDQDLPWGQ